MPAASSANCSMETSSRTTAYSTDNGTLGTMRLIESKVEEKGWGMAILKSTGSQHS